MANLNGFDANQVDPNVAFDPLPNGEYLVTIVESEMRKNANSEGEHLVLKMQVLDGEYAGRSLWDRLCLEHSNPTAVQIARGKLSSICRAVGVLTPKDSCELHDLPLRIQVAQKRRQDTGEMDNIVRDYKANKAGVASPPSPAQHSSNGTMEKNSFPWKQ